MARVLFFLAVFGLMLSGCSGMNGTQKAQASPAQELNIAYSVLPITMDGQLSSDVADEKYLLPMSGLLFRLDSNGGYEPDLAEGFTVSEDGCTYTIRLKENLRYGNGEPITAQDFVYAFRRLADPLNASQGIFLITDVCKVKNVEDVMTGTLPVEELGVSAPDARSLVVELSEPCPYFPYVLTKANCAPCSRSFYESCNGEYATSADTLLSSGPFIVDRYEPLGMQVHYVKNPYYVNADRVSLPGMTIREVASTQEAAMCYEAGEEDIIQMKGEYAALAEGDPALQQMTTGIIRYLAGNLKNVPAWGNRNIRLAIANAIDRESIVEHYFQTGAASLTRCIPTGFCVEEDGSDFAADPERYSDVCTFDADRARQYWQQGLKELGVDSLTIELMSASQVQALMEILKEQLEEALPGLTLDVRLASPGQLTDALSKGDFELYFMGWAADYPDPNSFLGILEEGSPMNRSVYASKAFNDLMNKAALETDPQKRMALLHQAEDTVMEDMAFIPLFSTGDTYLISEKVEGYFLTFNGGLSCEYSKKSR
ncbi:MAG: peptide ABC transporter substrate-binding protein [Lachnospiraceae bacterium]|nr:peptide ABC transporter substrate-binding protein [Lachnospiraceae bacterium]